MRQIILLPLAFWAAYALTVRIHYGPNPSDSFAQRNDASDFTFDYSTASPDPSNWIAVYHADHGGPKKQRYVEDSLVWAYAPKASGTIHLPVTELAPGNYEAYFLAKGGYEWLARPITNLYRKPDAVYFFTSNVTLQNARVGDKFDADISGLLGGGGGDVEVNFSITSTNGGDWVKISSDGRLHGTPDDAYGSTQVEIKALASDNSTGYLDVNIPVMARKSPLVRYLNVLTYNMWFGGAQVNNHHAKQVAFLASSNLDIVVLQESWGGQATRLQKALGWYGWQGRNSVGIISRYPIVEVYPQQGHGGALRIAVDGDDLQVNVWGVHLAYTPYGPYDFCYDNMTVAEVLAREEGSGRGKQIRQTLGLMDSQLKNSHQVPVLLAGDFNAPSHLDWTRENSAAHCGFGPVPWPTSKVPVDAGLDDSFRTIYPNPVTDPCITWSPIYLDNQGRPEPLDRIDILYHKGRLTVDAAERVVVGKPRPQPHHADNEWTSDHAAVRIRYDLKHVVGSVGGEDLADGEL